MSLLDLPIDVKVYIASKLECAWTWFALHDDDMLKYTKNNPHQFIALFTDHRIGEYYDGLYNITYLFNKIHSIYDQPARFNEHTKIWYWKGNVHRDTICDVDFCDGATRGQILPAWVTSAHHTKSHIGNFYMSGTRTWYKHGDVHREDDLPASIYGNGRDINNNYLTGEDLFTRGTKSWYRNNVKHRENDKPAVIHGDDPFDGKIVNEKEWWFNGVIHRDNDKPAHKRIDGVLFWCRNGKNHRDNGYAVWNPHNNTGMYYTDGVFIRAVDARAEGASHRGR